MPRIQPATYNLHIRQRASFDELLTLKAGGSPLILTGYSVVAQIWRDQKRDQKIVDLTVDFLDRLQGKIKLSLTRTQTRGLAGSGFWDLLVVEPGGAADYWMEGSVSVDVGLTDDMP